MTNTEEKIVMIFGTFDLLHAGHENLIRQARKHGDKIIAIIARDKTVKIIKGEAPENSEKVRLKNLAQTGWVNEAVLGNLKDKTKIIRRIKPDTIALGYDQFAFTQQLESMIIKHDLNSKIVRLKPFRPEIYKSSILKEQKDQGDFSRAHANAEFSSSSITQLEEQSPAPAPTKTP